MRTQRSQSVIVRLRPLFLPAWFALLGWAFGCGGDSQPQRPPGKELRTVRLERALPESPDRALLPGSEISHADLLARITGMATDPQVTGVLLQIAEFGGAWARAADLGDALQELRKAHKQVHCHVETTDNAGYALLARSCDRITMTPGGTLNLVGVAIDAVYARKLLQNVGVSAELIQAGRFKGAADPLTRDDMPAEVRQTMSAILDDLQGGLVGAISAGRKLDEAKVRALIDRGPFSAQDAKELGLVDDVVFDDAARAVAKQAVSAVNVTEDFPPKPHQPKGLFDVIGTLLSSRSDEKPSGPRLGLLYLEGTIMRGTTTSIRSSHAEAFVRAMREFADTRDIQAIVLRIDSPGGSALASDLMWHAVRRAAKRKPVIVSIGDLCASGGYYVASAGTEIVAQDDSLVGSIGVVGGKIVAQELADRVGVRVEHLGRGKHAGWTSATRTWSSDERASMERLLNATYDQFIGRIAEGRNLQPAQIQPYAEGRLMTARRAREGHLVDQVGGLRSALMTALDRGKLPRSAPVQVWPERPSLFQALSDLTDGSQSEARSAGAAPHALLRALLADTQPGIIETLLSGEQGPATVLPYLLTFH